MLAVSTFLVTTAALKEWGISSSLLLTFSSFLHDISGLCGCLLKSKFLRTEPFFKKNFFFQPWPIECLSLHKGLHAYVSVFLLVQVVTKNIPCAMFKICPSSISVAQTCHHLLFFSQSELSLQCCLSRHLSLFLISLPLVCLLNSKKNKEEGLLEIWWQLMSYSYFIEFNSKAWLEIQGLFWIMVSENWASFKLVCTV